MRYLVISFLSLLFVSCVGTVQESATPYSGVTNAPQQILSFQGVRSANGISDSRIEVFFFPATGGSGKFTYDIVVGSSPIPISVPSDVMTPDYRGLLKYTLTGLTRTSTYQIKVEARDNLTGAQSDSGVIIAATTFTNQVADFSGVSSASNLPGQDGKDSIKVRWTPARISGSLIKQEWDPKRYEVVIVDTERLTPADMDVSYGPSDGRWVYTFNHDDSMNEYIVRGLPSKTKFYVRMRAIHEASVDDVYILSKRSELNTNYLTISTLSPDLSDIEFQTDSFAVQLASGESGLNAIITSWTEAKGIFDHYRIYYSLEGGGVSSGVFPDLCLSELLSPPGETVFCKKVDYTVTNTPITGLHPYSNYEVVLILCTTSACGTSERIIAPLRTIMTDPSFPIFNGIRDILMAQYLEDIGTLSITFEPPSFTNGYFDGLILKMRRTIDGSDTPVELTTLTNPIYHDTYNFLTTSSITIRGIDYLGDAPYCFTLYPYKWDVDGVVKREMPNEIWKCVQPIPESPTSLQFPGLISGTTQNNAVTLNWARPTMGIFSHYELFWRKQSGILFSWGDAISQAGNAYNYTNYGRILVPSDEVDFTLTGFANGSYSFGIITYYSYVSDSGTVILRSETNSAVLNCTFDDTNIDPINCI